MIGDSELLDSTGGGRTQVVTVAAVTDQPTPGAFEGRQESGVRRVVSAIAAHINGLAVGGYPGACGVTGVEQFEGDCATRIACRASDRRCIIGEQILGGADR